MKKSIFIIITVLAVLFVVGCMQSVHALDLNLVESIRQNEIKSAENLTIENTVVSQQNTTTNNDTLEDINDGTALTTLTSYPDIEDEPATTVTTDYSTSSNTLSIGNILSILLIVVGFILVLLAIAILIRLKK